MDRYGTCYSCGFNEPVFVGGIGNVSWIETENCDVCPNRHKNEKGRCVLKECPANKPLRDEDGICYSCDYFFAINAENCEVCPNRHKNENGKCVLN